MIRFYSSDLGISNTLPAEESAHCVRVLRKHEGDLIEVVDGNGFAYNCRITDANPRQVRVDIIDKRAEPTHWGRKITLPVAPTKNSDRIEWMAEKATEMGVDNIVLLRCEHSERKVLKTDRLRRVVTNAMKQSLKATLPNIVGPVDFTEFIQEVKPESCKWIAHCEKDKPRGLLLQHLPALGQDIIILIGPEGDFSPKEIGLAIEKGFQPVTMGQSRLRTETAALFAIAALHAALDTNID